MISDLLKSTKVEESKNLFRVAYMKINKYVVKMTKTQFFAKYVILAFILIRNRIMVFVRNNHFKKFNSCRHSRLPYFVIVIEVQ